MTQQAVGKWETGRSTPDPQTVARLAEILDTPADVLLGLRKEPDASSAVGRNAFSRYTESQVPVVGTVRAGYGALAFEEDYGKEYACVKDPENYFFLVVKGDSMEKKNNNKKPRISDGDLALVHRQNTLDNGDLGVLVYGSDGEGTLKKYIQRGNSVILHPFNPAYEEMGIKGEDLCNIQGTPPNLFTEIHGDAFAPRNPQALKIDFVKRPPHFETRPTHKAKTWLLDPRAPKVEPPLAIRLLKEEGM